MLVKILKQKGHTSMANSTVCEFSLKKLVQSETREGVGPLRGSRRAVVRNKGQALTVLAAPRSQSLQVT